VKALTRAEAETKRKQAVEFLRRIGQDDEADRFEEMDAAEYAEHRGAELRENPKRRKKTVPRRKSAEQIQAELDDANDYIEQLETKLDKVAGIVSGDEDDDTEDTDDDDTDDADDNDQD
jgi:hypothetical protein